MKKSLIIIGILAIIFIIVTIVVVNLTNNKTKDAIRDTINKNSNLPYTFLGQDDVIPTNYEVLNNFMSIDYSNNDIYFSYYGYPNDESEYRLGEITLLTNKYNILGVKKGDNMAKSIEEIQKYGFKLEDRNNALIAVLKNGDITITLETNFDNIYEPESSYEVEKINIKAASKYLGSNLY